MADAPRVDLGNLNRKDPCPCGSGKKVKRCHGASNFEPQRSYQVQGRPIVTTSTPDKTIWAVGSRVFFHRANMTFHEFLFQYLADLLNRKWIVAEGQKDPKEQHHIFKCYQSYERISKEARSGTSAKVFRMKPDGATTSLLTLAYDCYQMEHSGNAMPNSWKKRLRDREAFQGVRYEILVAALFCRMGFKLEFLEDVQTKHCEFIATHTNYELPVAVEAKSRRRQGILHESGPFDFEKSVKGDIERLYRDALTHAPGDKPFVIFIDLNAPSTASEFPDKQWYQDVKDRILSLHKPSKHEPDPYSQFVVTNFAFHYGDISDAYSDENGRANRVKMGDFRLHLFESERSDAGIFSIYPFRFFSCALIHLLNLAGERYERCDREWHRRWLVHR
jgi:hypothetical protein